MSQVKLDLMWRVSLVEKKVYREAFLILKGRTIDPEGLKPIRSLLIQRIPVGSSSTVACLFKHFYNQF